MNQECTAYKTRILDYLSGNLKPDQAAEVSAHIEHCESCRKLVDSMGVMPYLSFMDETQIEESIARVRDAIQLEKRKEAPFTASPTALSERIKLYWKSMFHSAFALPVTALAAAALLLLAWFVGGFSLDRLRPGMTSQQVAQEAHTQERFPTPWLSAMLDGKHTATLFKPYDQHTKLGGLETLGGDTKGAHGEGKAPTGLVGNLFAVMTLTAEHGITSTAILLDRKRELLLSVLPVPDTVLLRSIGIQNEEGDIFLEQHIFLYDSMACHANVIFRDEAKGLALLFAPGIDYMLSKLNIAMHSEHPEVTPGPVDAIGAGFVLPDAVGNELDGRFPEFFYVTPLSVQATRGNDGETTLTLSGTIPDNLPDRLPLFSDDGDALLGVLVRTPQGNREVLSKNSIDGMVNNARSSWNEAREEYSSRQSMLKSHLASLEAKDLSQFLELSPPVSATVRLLEGEGHVLAVDLDDDDTSAMAIPVDYPGLLMKIQGGQHKTGENLNDIGLREER